MHNETSKSLAYARDTSHLNPGLHSLYEAFITVSIVMKMSQVSSDSIVSDYGLDNRAIRVQSPAGAKDFSYSLFDQTGFGAHPPSCTMCTVCPLPGPKAQLDHDADHSPPSSAEVEYE
jgi:hypothetical protein